jgi:hypothetical protein
MLKIPSKKDIKIPDLLYAALILEEKAQDGNAVPSSVYGTGQESLAQDDETFYEGQKEAIQLAYLNYQNQEPEQVIFYLAVFAKEEALRLESQGNAEEGLAVLIDAIMLGYEGLEIARPHFAGKLVNQLSSLVEQAFLSLAELGALSGLTKLHMRVSSLIDIAATIWEPNLKGIFRSLKEFLNPLCQMSHFETNQQRLLSRNLMERFRELKVRLNEISKSRVVNPGHLSVILTLVENWLQMVQQEILLVASAEYGSEGVDVSVITRQAHLLIGQIEIRLRSLIQKKYSQQFGESWVQHIASKHKNSYSYWLNNMSKDQSSFQQYNQFSPQILDYASTDDLRELITAQWQLFRNIFDFGYGDRNKAVFYDKMGHIIRVRNPLAHNRSIPENELLRAKVFCTDILLALDQAGEG